MKKKGGTRRRKARRGKGGAENHKERRREEERKDDFPLLVGENFVSLSRSVIKQFVRVSPFLRSIDLVITSSSTPHLFLPFPNLTSLKLKRNAGSQPFDVPLELLTPLTSLRSLSISDFHDSPLSPTILSSLTMTLTSLTSLSFDNCTPTPSLFTFIESRAPFLKSLTIMGVTVKRLYKKDDDDEEGKEKSKKEKQEMEVILARTLSKATSLEVLSLSNIHSKKIGSEIEKLRGLRRLTLVKSFAVLTSFRAFPLVCPSFI